MVNDLGQWIRDHNAILTEVGRWIRDHDVALNLWTLWAFLVFASTLSVLELGTWAYMIGTRDRSSLGPPLRRKKLAYVLAFSSIAALSALSLYAVHHDIQDELAIRVGFRFYGIIGMGLGCLFAVMFVVALVKERQKERRRVEARGKVKHRQKVKA